VSEACPHELLLFWRIWCIQYWCHASERERERGV
jgi:hypothetical protein